MHDILDVFSFVAMTRVFVFVRLVLFVSVMCSACIGPNIVTVMVLL